MHARRGAALAALMLLTSTACARGEAQTIVCDPSYQDTCIFPSPPDLDCKDIPHRRFKVRPPDHHHFDPTGDGLGCTTLDVQSEHTPPRS
jgi:micrococcal nuclease